MHEAAPEFVLFGPAHLVVLALTVVLPWGMVAWVRWTGSKVWERFFSWGLAGMLVALLVALIVRLVLENRAAPGSVDWTNFLPMHLCDWLVFATIAALIWRRQWCFEIAYFWGLAGTLQATITPDLHYGFPHIRFILFFVGHAGIIIAILYMIFALGLRPRAGSIIWAFLYLQVFVAVAGVTNMLLDTNFGYLMEPPRNASLIDHLGPWPWYILSLQGIALVSFVVYYAPWWIYDRVRAARGHGQDEG